jgi:hypothetical protein
VLRVYEEPIPCLSPSPTPGSEAPSRNFTWEQEPDNPNRFPARCHHTAIERRNFKILHKNKCPTLIVSSSVLREEDSERDGSSSLGVASHGGLVSTFGT